MKKNKFLLLALGAALLCTQIDTRAGQQGPDAMEVIGATLNDLRVAFNALDECVTDCKRNKNFHYESIARLVPAPIVPPRGPVPPVFHDIFGRINTMESLLLTLNKAMGEVMSDSKNFSYVSITAQIPASLPPATASGPVPLPFVSIFDAINEMETRLHGLDHAIEELSKTRNK